MKTIKMYLMSFMLMVFASISMAAETTTIEKGQTLAGIKTELIEKTQPQPKFTTTGHSELECIFAAVTLSSYRGVSLNSRTVQ